MKMIKRLIFLIIIFSFSKNFIFSIQRPHIIYNSTNTSKNPLFWEKKNKKLALLLTKRACKGGIIMKKIVLLFVALLYKYKLYSLFLQCQVNFEKNFIFFKKYIITWTHGKSRLEKIFD